MSKTVRTLVLGTALSAAATLPVAASDNRFDGTWSVDLITESGFCDARTHYTLSVADGEVHPVARGTGGASVTGRVKADGAVGLNVSTTSASGTVSGRLQPEAGAGVWRVSALCSGRWTARRQATRTAQAG